MPELLRREWNDDWFDEWFLLRRGRVIAALNQSQLLRFFLVELRHFFFQYERDQKQPVKNRAEG